MHFFICLLGKKNTLIRLVFKSNSCLKVVLGAYLVHVFRYLDYPGFEKKLELGETFEYGGSNRNKLLMSKQKRFIEITVVKVR